uniref:BRCT domain-containing protein n=1 Tax=Ciona savignyi TaxID=51511 RepID=H2YZY5_CIOSA
MTSRVSNRKLGVMASGIRGKGLSVVKAFTKKFGGTFHNKFVPGEVTHVIVRTEQSRCDRTLKYLQAIASKSWVVSILWVTQSLKQKKLLSEIEFEVITDSVETDPVLFNGPRRSRESAKDFKLLSDFYICCYPPFALFTADEFMELLKMCGAAVTTNLNELKSDRSNQRKVIAFDADAYTGSLPNYTEIASRNNAEAVSSNWALECIATFTVQPTAVFPVEEFESEMT